MKKSVSSWSPNMVRGPCFPLLLDVQCTTEYMGLKSSIMGDKAKSKRWICTLKYPLGTSLWPGENLASTFYNQPYEGSPKLHGQPSGDIEVQRNLLCALLYRLHCPWIPLMAPSCIMDSGCSVPDSEHLWGLCPATYYPVSGLAGCDLTDYLKQKVVISLLP